MVKSETLKPQAAKPYDKLPQSKVAELSTVLTHFQACADAWNSSGQLLSPLVGLVAKVNAINKEFVRLSVNEESGMSVDPLPPSTFPADVSTPTLLLPTPSLHGFVTQSGTNLILIDVDPVLDTSLNLSTASNFLMSLQPVDVERLRRQIERLMSLTKTILVERLSFDSVKVFHRDIKSLNQLAPVLYRLMRLARLLICIVDYAGLGWILGSKSIQQNAVAAAPASFLALTVVEKVVNAHNGSMTQLMKSGNPTDVPLGMIEICSLHVFKGTLFFVEAGLIQERLNLHTFTRQFISDRISTLPWLETPGKHPSYREFQAACDRGRLAILALIKHPLGAPGEVMGGLHGEINTLITILATRYYFREDGLAHQACILEGSYPGITNHDLGRDGRPFIDFFPLAAFCLPLFFVMCSLHEGPLLVNIHCLDYGLSLDDVPSQEILSTIMGGVRRMDVSLKRNKYLEFYPAFQPHIATFLGPLDRVARQESSKWLAELSA